MCRCSSLVCSTRGVVRTPIDAATAAANGAVARSIGEQVAVLLKNDQKMLPLDASKIRSIALIGQQTFAGAAASGGGGSSRVVPTYTVTPLQGLQNVLTPLARPRRSIRSSSRTTIAILQRPSPQPKRPTSPL